MGGVYDVIVILSCFKWKMKEEGRGSFFLLKFCEVVGGKSCLGKWNEKVMDFGQ